MANSKKDDTRWTKLDTGIRVRYHATRKHGPRPDMYFVLRFSVDGKSIQEALGWASEGITLAKARLELARLKEANRTGEGPVTLKEKRKKALKEREEEASKLTVGELWNFYNESKSDRSAVASDESNYKHFEKALGKKKPEDLRTEDMEDLRDQLLGKRYSPQTIKHVLGLLRRILRFGEKRGKCVIPPPKLLTIEMPTFDNTVTECLSSDEIKRLLQVLDEEKDQVQASVMRLALATGIRKSAILGLKWEHLDFERKTITLAGVTAKNRRTAYVPMNMAAQNMLELIPKTSSPYVFPGKMGNKRRDIRRMADRVKKKAKLPASFRPLHGLRHTFACNLANSGRVTLQTIQALLTHSSTAVTERYAHLQDNILREGSEVAASNLCFMGKKSDDDEGRE